MQGVWQDALAGCPGGVQRRAGLGVPIFHEQGVSCVCI